ncbi:MAG: glycosyltransferase family 4 protein [Bacteroidia bacterium]|nr:glycosyltransferase family 4 protein [Bacteroidia bacterium]
MNHTLKVIFCTDGIFPHAIGGIQRHTRLLVEELAKNGNCDIIVIHPHKDIRVFENPAVKEIHINPLPGKRQYLLEKYQLSREVYEIVKQYPDYVVYAQGLTVWYGIKKLKNRLIVNPHGLEMFQTLTWQEWGKLGIFRKVMRHVFKSAHTVISLGGRLTDILNHAVKNKSTQVAVIPNAVNLSASKEEKIIKTGIKDPIHCLFVGRFAFNKGIDVLMKAVKILNERGYGNKFVFSLAGKGPLFESYKQQYPFTNVHFLGFVSDEDLFKLYKTHHLFVLPTLFEGMPTVVLEAMTEGMPVIVTDVGATKELVDETNGYIIEKKNVEDLVQKLIAFHDLPQSEKAGMSQASLERVKTRFVWSQVAKQHEDLFASIKI